MDRRQRIEQRLRAGECPVKMSREHWEHNREIVESGLTLTTEDTTSDGCALCVFVDLKGLGCSHCALVLATELRCSHPDSPWVNVREKMHKYALGARSPEYKEMLLPAIDDMLEALHRAESLEVLE